MNMEFNEAHEEEALEILLAPAADALALIEDCDDQLVLDALSAICSDGNARPGLVVAALRQKAQMSAATCRVVTPFDVDRGSLTRPAPIPPPISGWEPVATPPYEPREERDEPVYAPEPARAPPSGHPARRASSGTRKVGWRCPGDVVRVNVGGDVNTWWWRDRHVGTWMVLYRRTKLPGRLNTAVGTYNTGLEIENLTSISKALAADLHRVVGLIPDTLQLMGRKASSAHVHSVLLPSPNTRMVGERLSSSDTHSLHLAP